MLINGNDMQTGKFLLVAWKTFESFAFGKSSHFQRKDNNIFFIFLLSGISFW